MKKLIFISILLIASVFSFGQTIHEQSIDNSIRVYGHIEIDDSYIRAKVGMFDTIWSGGIGIVIDTIGGTVDIIGGNLVINENSLQIGDNITIDNTGIKVVDGTEPFSLGGISITDGTIVLGTTAFESDIAGRLKFENDSLYLYTDGSDWVNLSAGSGGSGVVDTVNTIATKTNLTEVRRAIKQGKVQAAQNYHSTIIADFEGVNDEWTTLTNASISNEKAYEGNYAIKYSIPASSTGTAIIELDEPIDARRKGFTIRMITDSISNLRLNIGSCYYRVISQTTGTAVWYLLGDNSFNAFSRVQWFPYEDWNLQVFIAPLYDTTSMMFDRNIYVDAFEFRWTTNSFGGDAVIYMDNLKMYEQPNYPVIVLHFDDALKSMYNNVLPIADKWGAKIGTAAVIEFLDDTYSGAYLSEPMSWDELRDLQSRGHEVVSHTWKHSIYPPDSAFLIARERMISEGIDPVSASIHIPPSGNITRASINMAKDNYIALRRRYFYKKAETSSINPLVGGDWYAWADILLDGMVAADTSVVKRHINTLKYNGTGMLYFYGHDVWDTDSVTPYSTELPVVKTIIKEAHRLGIPIVGMVDVVTGNYRNIISNKYFDRETGIYYPNVQLNSGQLFPRPKAPDSPWVMYEINRHSASTLYDLAGNTVKLDGTVTAGMGWKTEPRHLVRSVTGDYISIAATEWIGNDDFTFCGWVYLTSFTGGELELFWEQENTTGTYDYRHRINITSAGRLSYRNNVAATGYSMQVNQTIILNQWTFVAFSRFKNTGTSKEEYRFYVCRPDGKRFQMTPTVFNDLVTVDNDAPYFANRIGWLKGAGGKVGNTAIYKRMLSEDEIYNYFLKYKNEYWD